ncbi:Ferric siderophore transport system, periplasmic binding protein TonB [Leucobacter sp. 7(1)]|uniref:HtaA domain-containing protein n=1 Tax=Leucobacter sp. 7(1) TaxID=1255613 RepID=UPI00097EE6D4|nr:HtaA domain-containing protein [Leucobacter sp. 7(1)]SJN08256.1 Ferric siderophore transport system, periplasmic binding protein TonB [Leucobacter sp. 7(1)]
MHARNVFRGLAAAALSTALVIGGAVGEPAFAEESVIGDSQQIDPANSVSVENATDVSEAEVPSESPEAPQGGAEVVEPGNPGKAPELSFKDGDVEAENPAPELQGPVPESETNSAVTSAAEAPDLPTEPVAGPENVKIQFEASVAPKKSLEVQVSASGFPAGVTDLSAALIPQGDTAVLTGPTDRIPALAKPLPRVTDGASSFVLTAAVSQLVRAAQYEIVLWPSDEKPAQSNIFARVDLKLSSGEWDQLLGPVPPVAEEGSISWGVLERFRNYVETKAGPKGKVSATKPASYNGKLFTFPQVTGGKWGAGTQRGVAQYGGSMRFYGHNGGLDLNMSNPVIRVIDSKRAELSVTTTSVELDMESERDPVIKESVDVIASIDLSSATSTTRKGGAIRWANANATLTTAGVDVFQGFYSEGQPLDLITFTVGSERDVKPITPPKPKPVPKPKPKPVPKPLPPTVVDGNAGGAQAAGSLSWGVSSAFSKYVTGPIAKGEVATSGVGSSGGGYLFPQAAGGSWDTATQTGSVQYSGVISFTGHKGLLSESMSNPMIQVTGPDSAVIYNGGSQWGTLNLAAAAKSVGANGEVTWSGVPVSGGFSGGASGGSQYTLAADPLTFTVGTASGVSYGSTAVSNDSLKRTAAASAPTTSGIRILTDPKKLVPGGEIELEAPGFTAKEREALVVLYPGVIVLDEAAGADTSGTVRWLGTIPEDLPLGEYVITVQGSTDAGAVLEVRKPEPKAKAAAKQQRVAELAAQQEAGAPAAAGVVPAADDQAAWMWWAASIGLLAVAGVMGGLVVGQRRKAAAGNTPPGSGF